MRRQRARQRQRRGRTCAEADRRRDLALLDQRDVLDEQSKHALALTLGRLRIAPDGGEVVGQGEDAASLFVTDGQPVGGALPLVVLSSFVEGAQSCVPVGFQRVSDESIGRVHVHVALAGEVCFVLCSLDLTVAQTVGFVDTTLHLLLHGERHFERHRRDGFDKEVADGGVDLSPHDALTERVAEEVAATDADVVGNALTTPVAVADVHATAAQSAHGAALQECRTFAGRTLRPIEMQSLAGHLKSLLVQYVLVPRNAGDSPSVKCSRGGRRE